MHAYPRLITEAMPVELLRDRRGIYGIGAPDEYDFEALAWKSGVEGDPYQLRTPPRLILRPDYFEHTEPYRAVLQRIVGGFRHGIFCHSTEERLRQFIHHEALRRAGLPWPPTSPYQRERWWSSDKAQQAQNRRVYHGLRLLSLGVINRLIGELHEAAADQDAVRAARRFYFQYREKIYRAAARSRRALQLIDTFPLVALATYSDTRLWRSQYPQSAAVNLVERGARLREVAAALGIPMAFRHLKPGVAHLVSSDLIQHPDLLRWMPRTTPAARIWLVSVYFAQRHGGIDYARWVARHVSEMPGRLDQVGAVITDLWDWIGGSNTSGRQFVTRPFTPVMGLKTALKLSHDWHEAVANNMDGPDGAALPPPWYPAAKQGDFDIVPLTTSAELYREGRAMHHCVVTLVEHVRRGARYVFSVRRNGERVATVSLLAIASLPDDCARILIDQVRGPCNALPPKAVIASVRRWLQAQPATVETISQQYEAWCAQVRGRSAPSEWPRQRMLVYDDIPF